MCRTDREIPKKEREKLALFCNVKENSVIAAPDLNSIYEAPISYNKQKLDQAVLNAFNISPAPAPNLKIWKDVSFRLKNAEGEVNVAIIPSQIKTCKA